MNKHQQEILCPFKGSPSGEVLANISRLRSNLIESVLCTDLRRFLTCLHPKHYSAWSFPPFSLCSITQESCSKGIQNKPLHKLVNNSSHNHIPFIIFLPISAQTKSSSPIKREWFACLIGLPALANQVTHASNTHPHQTTS